MGGRGWWLSPRLRQPCTKRLPQLLERPLSLCGQGEWSGHSSHFASDHHAALRQRPHWLKAVLPGGGCEGRRSTVGDLSSCEHRLISSASSASNAPMPQRSKSTSTATSPRGQAARGAYRSTWAVRGSLRPTLLKSAIVVRLSNSLVRIPVWVGRGDSSPTTPASSGEAR